MIGCWRVNGRSEVNGWAILLVWQVGCAMATASLCTLFCGERSEAELLPSGSKGPQSEAADTPLERRSLPRTWQVSLSEVCEVTLRGVGGMEDNECGKH